MASPLSIGWQIEMEEPLEDQVLEILHIAFESGTAIYYMIVEMNGPTIERLRIDANRDEAGRLDVVLYR